MAKRLDGSSCRSVLGFIIIIIIIVWLGMLGSHQGECMENQRSQSVVPAEAAWYQLVPVCFQWRSSAGPSQSLLASTVQPRRLTFSGHVAQMDDNADAEAYMFVLRRAGKDRQNFLISHGSRHQKGLKFHNLTLTEALIRLSNAQFGSCWQCLMLCTLVTSDASRWWWWLRRWWWCTCTLSDQT